MTEAWRAWDEVRTVLRYQERHGPCAWVAEAGDPLRGRPAYVHRTDRGLVTGDDRDYVEAAVALAPWVAHVAEEHHALQRLLVAAELALLTTWRHPDIRGWSVEHGVLWVVTPDPLWRTWLDERGLGRFRALAVGTEQEVADDGAATEEAR